MFAVRQAVNYQDNESLRMKISGCFKQTFIMYFLTSLAEVFVMKNQLSELFKEAINIELNAARLYELFQRNFPEDSVFWGQLIFEEKNHAALLQDGRDRFLPIGKFPEEILPSSLTSLVWANRGVAALIDKYRQIPPSREEAFNAALGLEISAGEAHYQQFMEKESPSKVEKIFQELNRDDKDHALRLRSYMKKHGIKIEK